MNGRQLNEHESLQGACPRWCTFANIPQIDFPISTACRHQMFHGTPSNSVHLAIVCVLCELGNPEIRWGPFRLVHLRRIRSHTLATILTNFIWMFFGIPSLKKPAAFTFPVRSLRLPARSNGIAGIGLFDRRLPPSRAASSSSRRILSDRFLNKVLPILVRFRHSRHMLVRIQLPNDGVSTRKLEMNHVHWFDNGGGHEAPPLVLQSRHCAAE